MLERRRPPDAPVTIYLDGAPVIAERGEPLAVALIGAGKGTLARSPKLHRPRGPSCLRGACDGCLARVDGVPNVMTCLRPAVGGEHIETQNVIGSRESDVLRVTDWFFPQGIDHHHLMAGIPGVSSVMQAFARKLAGLGRLPEAIAAPKEARVIETDALVVGAGLAGQVVASRLSGGGARVCLVDDGAAPGGSLLGAPDLAERIERKYPLHRAEVRACHVAAGVYLGEVLLASEEGAVVVRAKARVFATGAHDGVLAVPNNDLPGLFSARAVAQLAARGITPKGTTAIVGEGFWADRAAEALGEANVVRVPAARVESVVGTSRVRGLRVRGEGGDGEARAIEVSVIGVSIPGAPSFEVAAQAGAGVRFEALSGYVLNTDERGRAAEGVWAAGECTGIQFDPDRIVAQAERVAADVEKALGR